MTRSVYVSVLADLRRRRDALNKAILALREAVECGAITDEPDQPGAPDPCGGNVRHAHPLAIREDGPAALRHVSEFLAGLPDSGTRQADSGTPGAAPPQPKRSQG